MIDAEEEPQDWDDAHRKSGRTREDVRKEVKSPVKSPAKSPKKPARDALRFNALKPTVFDARSIPFVLRKLHAFVKAPAPSGGGVVVRCFIERKRSWQHSLHPMYKLYADHEDGTGRLLMAARKMPFSSTSHYAFSTSVDDLFKDRESLM